MHSFRIHGIGSHQDPSRFPQRPHLFSELRAILCHQALTLTVNHLRSYILQSAAAQAHGRERGISMAYRLDKSAPSKADCTRALVGPCLAPFGRVETPMGLWCAEVGADHARRTKSISLNERVVVGAFDELADGSAHLELVHTAAVPALDDAVALLPAPAWSEELRVSSMDLSEMTQGRGVTRVNTPVEGQAIRNGGTPFTYWHPCAFQPGHRPQAHREAGPPPQWTSMRQRAGSNSQ